MIDIKKHQKNIISNYNKVNKTNIKDYAEYNRIMLDEEIKNKIKTSTNKKSK